MLLISEKNDYICNITLKKGMPSADATYTQIDLDAIIRERAGKKARFIPHFAVNALKRLIHQDFINGYLRQGRVGVDFCTGALEYLGVTLDVIGRENLLHDNKYHTFVCNHPLGAIDGIALGSILGSEYNGRIKYLVNDLLMNLKGLAPLCVPINKIGKQARNFPTMVESAFAGENHVVMFPAGLCSRQQKNGNIEDIPWSKTFVAKSVQHQRDVVPLYFEGTNSPRFYRVAKWCKCLHLPNFAMALLPDEMYRNQGKHYTVRVGNPIPWQTLDKSKKPMEWAQIVRQTVYDMAKQ